jgi:anti-sigma regulatory factor (Ser/Thr protein kinase)
LDVLATITLPAQLSSLQAFLDFVRTCSREQGFKQKKIHAIELATEEALVNIFSYAYEEKNGDVEIICKIDDGDTFMLEIIDTGIPFDILSVKDPDIAADISERQIGGHGIFLMKKLMDSVHYRREGNKNILALIVHKYTNDI